MSAKIIPRGGGLSRITRITTVMSDRVIMSKFNYIQELTGVNTHFV